MPSLSYNTKICPPLEIADNLPSPGCNFPLLQKLTGGSLLQDAIHANCILEPRNAERKGSLYFDSEQSCHRMIALPETEYDCVIAWRSALLFAIAAKVLKGEPVALMHGCLLQTDSNEGILLCGQSGMGKSTTASRWKNAGGICPADDMILLEYNDREVIAHPLPTWSRCIVSLEGEYFPFENALPLKTILALNRGETHEEVRQVEEYNYMTSLYAACVLFNLNTLKRLNAEHKNKLIEVMKNTAQMLCDRFPHRALYAHLQCNLKESLSKL